MKQYAKQILIFAVTLAVLSALTELLSMFIGLNLDKYLYYPLSSLGLKKPGAV